MDQAEDEEMHRLDKVAGEVGEAGRGEEGRHEGRGEERRGDRPAIQEALEHRIG